MIEEEITEGKYTLMINRGVKVMKVALCIHQSKWNVGYVPVDFVQNRQRIMRTSLQFHWIETLHPGTRNFLVVNCETWVQYSTLSGKELLVILILIIWETNMTWDHTSGSHKSRNSEAQHPYSHHIPSSPFIAP